VEKHTGLDSFEASIRPASSSIGDGITLIEVEQNREKIGFSFGEAVAID